MAAGPGGPQAPPADGTSGDPASPDAAPAPRRRRRAVGPPGAAPSRDSGRQLLQEPERAQPEDAQDEHLRREVPPHHGG